MCDRACMQASCVTMHACMLLWLPMVVVVSLLKFNASNAGAPVHRRGDWAQRKSGLVRMLPGCRLQAAESLAEGQLWSSDRTTCCFGGAAGVTLCWRAHPTGGGRVAGCWPRSTVHVSAALAQRAVPAQGAIPAQCRPGGLPTPPRQRPRRGDVAAAGRLGRAGSDVGREQQGFSVALGLLRAGSAAGAGSLRSGP